MTDQRRRVHQAIRTMPKAIASLLLVSLAVASPLAVSEQGPAQPGRDLLDRASVCLYNMDVASAHAAIDESLRLDPRDPLSHAFRATTYLFAELKRLRILETRFFMSDDTIAGERAAPDEATKTRLYSAVTEARRLAAERLARDANDRDALFAMCMSASTVMDYAALVEARLFRTIGLARETKQYADRLLALTPPVYDAYLAYGTIEYTVGSLPFFIRWFVHFDNIRGDKQRGVEHLRLVARQGRYYGPLARILLAIASLREGKPGEAEKLLTELSEEFPGNPTFRKEAAHAAELARRSKGGRR